MIALVPGLRQGLLIGLVLAAYGCNGHDGAAADEAAMKSGEFVQFSTLVPPATSNNWLVAPTDGGPPGARQAAPVFDVPAIRLAEAWRSLVEAQPRTAILGVSPDGLQIEAQQKSAVFGFIDRISMRAVPLAPDRSTLMAYSRATLGVYDFGVNRRRLQSWVSALASKLGADAPAAQ